MKEFHHPNKKINLTPWLLPGKPVTNIFLVTALIIIFFLVWLIFIYSKSPFDQQAFNTIAPHITEGRTRFMLFITFFGNHAFLIPANLLLLIFFLIKKNNRLALTVGLASLGGLSIKLILKQIFHRLRPGDPLIEGGVAGFSFPSGHALMGVAFYGLLIWLAAKRISNKLIQGLLIAFFLTAILTIGFSRIYLRVHYTTDVMAGFCIGFVWLITCFWLMNKIGQQQ